MPYYDILTRPTTASQIAYFGNFRDGGEKFVDYYFGRVDQFLSADAIASAEPISLPDAIASG